MLFDHTVKIHSETRKVVFQKRKDVAYVLYEVDRVYVPERKLTLPKRVTVGKRCPDNPEMMWPNEKYYELFPNEPMPENDEVTPRSSCLKLGSHIIIDKVIQEYELNKILGNHFDERDVGLIIDLATYQIIEEHNAAQYYPDYAYNHPLFTPSMSILSDSTISEFFSSVTHEQIQGFLNEWNINQDKKDRLYISYDSTNKNTQAGDIDIVEFGKAKDEKGLPIFNVSLAFDQTNEKPLFYEMYPGSINDVSQFQYMVDRALDYNYKNIGFILDRGYFSRANIEYMDKYHYAFIMMIKGCKPLVKSLVLERFGHFEYDPNCLLNGLKLSGVTVKHPLYKGDRQRHIHVYYSSERMNQDRNQFLQNLNEMRQLHEKVKGKVVSFTPIHERYFDLNFDDQGRFLCATQKNEMIEEDLKLCGYFAIVTSEVMTAEEAYRLYKGRDSSEKLFRADKSFLGADCMRVHSGESLATKTFVGFIALIIRNRIYCLLREQMQRLTVKRNYLTVPAAIRELEKIEMIRGNDGRYRIDHALTQTQKTILGSFGIDEEWVRTKAVKVADTLANSSVNCINSDKCYKLK